MVSGLGIVRARTEDAEPILALKVRAFAAEFARYGACSIPPGFDSLERQRRTLEELLYFQAKLDGELVGAACVVDLGTGVFVLASLYVDPAHQGQGIGSEMVHWLEREFPSARRWRLETPYLSFANHRFYERLGYRKIGEHVPAFAEGSGFRLFDYQKTVGE